jgi:radical SAM protein with 4Fe4S-binding SPASM domain
MNNIQLDTSELELKLEITDRCNSKCTFCHHGDIRLQKTTAMLFSTAARWFDWAARENIYSIRITGGEPTLHPDLEQICRHAQSKGLFVSLNTNGFGKKALYRKIFPVIDEIKVSLPHPHPESLDRLTGIKNSLKKKLETITSAVECGLKAEILSAMVPENIGLLEEYVLFVKDIPRLSWCPLRVEPSPENRRPISRLQLQTLAEEIKHCTQKYPELNLKLRLATPFCAVKPIELGAEVLRGRGEDCGPFKSLTVDTSGELISCYSCRNPIKLCESLEAIQQDKEFVSLASLESLPIKCRECAYVERCMGGCSSPFAVVSSGGGRIDYLAEDK